MARSRKPSELVFAAAQVPSRSRNQIRGFYVSAFRYARFLVYELSFQLPRVEISQYLQAIYLS